MKSTASVFFVLAISLPLALGACASRQPDTTLPPSITQDATFMSWLAGLDNAVDQDPKYRRIPLDSPAQTNEFAAHLHDLYRGRTSEAEFRSWVNSRYPGHAYEQNVIIRYLDQYGPRRS
ncbi:hypothetical protein HW532_12615 [Kaustia mangrovi]|uniref:DUF1549 domain-containing protein n=1 Tax=Kaustia mangrovi TaxID=2593653 RepID=A0A7S8C512_9HYPH|nr:hypothetical protein [Kaustia mangrovi]QPC43461.1 hypothetical protein HW532_12615 [Kaustia mangrovi]